MAELYMPKTVWTVGEKPKGRYRSFSHRPWPIATYHNRDGPAAARLIPVLVDHKDYYPQIREKAVLQLSVADYRGASAATGAFVWRKLTMAVTGYSAAVNLWEDWLYAHLSEWVIPEDLS